MSRNRRLRAVAALTIGCVTGMVCYHFVAFQDGGYHPSDFEFWWRATRLWTSGHNPYATQKGMMQWPLVGGLWYPLPALILTLPLQWLTLPLAAAIFVGGSSGWLAWVLTRYGWWRLWIFVGPGELLVLRTAQWSPLLTAAAVVPWAGFLLAAKPTLGLACFLYRPTWRALLSALVILVLSLVIWPAWPGAWIAAVRSVPSHGPPILRPFGWLLGLAVLRWRTPEGRLLLAMAFMPQLLFFYDQLPLGLVARTATEAMVLSLAALVAMLAWSWVAVPHPYYVEAAAPYVMCGCYLPALVIVLRRTNEGDVPALLARLTAWHWRGRSLTEHDAG